MWVGFVGVVCLVVISSNFNVMGLKGWMSVNCPIVIDALSSKNFLLFLLFYCDFSLLLFVYLLSRNVVSDLFSLLFARLSIIA